MAGTLQGQRYGRSGGHQRLRPAQIHAAQRAEAEGIPSLHRAQLAGLGVLDLHRGVDRVKIAVVGISLTVIFSAGQNLLAQVQRGPLGVLRIQRALEVFRLTGRPISSFHRERAETPDTPPLLALEPASRAWLHERIAQRFDTMLAGGFIDEVTALRARGDLHPDLPSMRCVGYRQVWEELDFQASRPAGTPLNIAFLRERGIAATRQLAKRQITWLRSMPQRQVVPCDAPDALVQLLRAVEAGA